MLDGMTNDPRRFQILTMKRISALLLSAGKSSNAGVPKPLMQWNEETFLSKVFRSLDDTKVLREIVIVTGYQMHALGQELKRIQGRFTVNPFYEQGQHSSIRWGLTKFQKEWDGVLIAMVDQPQLETADYMDLIKPFQVSNKTLCWPSFDGHCGNPMIVGREHFAEIMSEREQNQSCSYLFQRHPQEVLNVKMKSARCLVDFDTPEALEIYAHCNF